MRAAVFALVLIAVLAGLNGVIAATVVSDDELRYRAIFEDRPHRQLILGTSRAAYGLDPAAFGDDTYNFAHSGSNPIFYEHWYRHYRRRHGPPERVVYATDWFLFNRFLWRQAEQDSEFLPWPIFLEGLTGRGMARGTMLLNRFPLLKERAFVLERLFGAPPPEAKDPAYLARHYRQGFLPLIKTDKPLSAEGAFQPAEDPRQQEAFTRLLETMRAEGVRIAFVVVPDYRPVLGEHPGELAAIRAIAEARGIPMLDYSHDAELGDRPLNFYDAGHLSSEGSRALGLQLQADLRTIGFRP